MEDMDMMMGGDMEAMGQMAMANEMM